MAIGDKLEFVGEVQGDGSAGTLTISGIPTDSQSFILTGIASTVHSSYSAEIWVRFNNDANSRYRWCAYLSSWGGNPSATQHTGTGVLMVTIPPNTLNSGKARSWFYTELWNLSQKSTSPGSPSMMAEVGGKNNTTGDTPYSGMQGAGSYSYTDGAPTGTDVTSLSFYLNSGAPFTSESILRLYKRPTS